MPVAFTMLSGTALACRYHDGYLTIHFEANKYQDIELSPLQEEALWCAAHSTYACTAHGDGVAGMLQRPILMPALLIHHLPTGDTLCRHAS